MTLTPSCDRCKKRKVKCDRAVPCLHCRRHNVTCHTTISDVVKPRGRQGGRIKEKEKIQARLARLESLLEDLTQAGAAEVTSTPGTNDQSTETRETKDKASGDRLHRYVAGPVWSQLSAQV